MTFTLQARFAALLLVVLMSLLAAPAAWAHAQLLETSPADGAVLEIAPQAVSLSFSEPVTPMAVSLVAPDGNKTDVLLNTQAGQTVIVTLPAGLERGTQVLSWRVVSVDGHPIGGSLVFSIGVATGTAPLADSADRVVAVLLWGVKAMLYIALLGGIGGAVFAGVTPVPESAGRVALGLSLAGLPLSALALWLQGLDTLGLPLGWPGEPAPWRAALTTSFGPTAIVLAVAFTLAVLALSVRSIRQRLVVGTLAALAAAVSLALSGHASAANPQWLTRPAVFLHIAGLLFWIGALLPLWLSLRGQAAAADRALARFSRVVPVAVAAILLSGMTLASIQMGWPGPSWLSPYGTILALKLLLLALLFGLALWNRGWLTQPALAGEAAARAHLRRSITLEGLIVVLVLGLVAGWRFTPPPRALAVIASVAEPIYVHAMTDTMMANLTVTPGHVGPTTLELSLDDMEGVPLAPQAVSVTLSQPSLQIEPFKRDAVLEDGFWMVHDLTIPVAGDWLVEIDIRASRFELVKLQADLAIP